MTSEQHQTAMEVSVPVDLTPEECAAIPDHERMGIIVAQAYGTALAERDQARAVADSLAVTHASLLEAAADVLALDLVQHPTFAHDENAVARLRCLVDAGIDAMVVDSTRTQED